MPIGNRVALILIGPTCSGKTTFCRRLQKIMGDSIRCVSPDEVRRAFVLEYNRTHDTQLVYQNTFPLDVDRHPDRMTFNQICIARTASLLRSWAESPYQVICDDVNLRAADREPLVKLFRANHRRVVAVLLDQAKSIIMERLLARDREYINSGVPPLNIPEFVVDQQISTLEDPERDVERFDMVYRRPSTDTDGWVDQAIRQLGLKEAAFQ